MRAFIERLNNQFHKESEVFWAIKKLVSLQELAGQALFLGYLQPGSATLESKAIQTKSDKDGQP